MCRKDCKPNKENSGIIQALLDIKKAGGEASLVDALIEMLRENESLLIEAEELFKGHQYPQHSLAFCKLSNEFEFARFLSPKALVLLIAMCQNMWHGNLIQLSQRDILKITSISSLSSIKPALKELIDCGCITIAIEGTTRKPTVYMVNPCIATIGREISYLKDIFWEYTGSNYRTKPVIYSAPHEKWNELTSKRTYSKSRVSFQPDSTSSKLSYNCISEPKVKMKKRKAATSADNEGIDEDLSFLEKEA